MATGSEHIHRWPARIEYAAALRTPKSCFVDPDLQAGVLAVNKRTKQTLMRSGQFSSVFHVATATTPFAVKCFVRSQAGREERSRRLSRLLDANPRDWYVPFEFQDPGIRVGGRKFPIVKMQWIDGHNLEEYITEHVGDSPILLSLAQQFRLVVEDLEACGWAHGDLQHGNIIVTSDGQLKLVDYDGMYAPELEAMPSHELGHPNYQHPSRASGELELYGPHMDRYASWIIYGAILACALDPACWERYGGGDNGLLLRSTDLRDPAASPALLAWSESAHDALRQTAAALTAVLTRPADATPALRRLQGEELLRDASGSVLGDAPAKGGAQGLAARIDHERTRRRATARGARDRSEQARRSATQQARREAAQRAISEAKAAAGSSRRRELAFLAGLVSVATVLLVVLLATSNNGSGSNTVTTETARPEAPPQPPPPVPTLAGIRRLLNEYAHDITVGGFAAPHTSDFTDQTLSPLEPITNEPPHTNSEHRVLATVDTGSIVGGPGVATGRARLIWSCRFPSTGCYVYVSHANFRTKGSPDGSLALEKVVEWFEPVQSFSDFVCPCTIRFVDTVKRDGHPTVIAAGTFHTATAYANWGAEVPLTAAGRSLLTPHAQVSVSFTPSDGSTSVETRADFPAGGPSLWQGSTLRLLPAR